MCGKDEKTSVLDFIRRNGIALQIMLGADVWAITVCSTIPDSDFRKIATGGEMPSATKFESTVYWTPDLLDELGEELAAFMLRKRICDA